MNDDENKRHFTINSDLLTEFKFLSKKNSKSYKTATEEAIKLWIEKQKGEDKNE